MLFFLFGVHGVFLYLSLHVEHIPKFAGVFSSTVLGLRTPVRVSVGVEESILFDPLILTSDAARLHRLAASLSGPFL